MRRKEISLLICSEIQRKGERKPFFFAKNASWQQMYNKHSHKLLTDKPSQADRFVCQWIRHIRDRRDFDASLF